MPDDPATRSAMKRLTLAIGTPAALRIPADAVLCALASIVGNLERLTLREAGSSMAVVEEGYRKIRTVSEPRRQHLLPVPINVQIAVRRIQEQIQIRGSVPISTAVWLSVLASVLGQLAACECVPLSSIRILITEAWARTPEADVEQFQRMSKVVAEA